MWVQYLLLRSASNRLPCAACCRLKSLIRRLQQQEAFEQDPSKSSNNQPCDSEETDDADEDEPTFPEMATALEKVFVNWQYEDTELQQEGLELLQRAYEHVGDI